MRWLSNRRVISYHHHNMTLKCRPNHFDQMNTANLAALVSQDLESTDSLRLKAVLGLDALIDLLG
jgi:hypothetical protein